MKKNKKVQAKPAAAIEQVTEAVKRTYFNADSAAWFFVAIFIAASITWMIKTNDTWDDDAVTRYFLEKQVSQNPHLLLDSWIRPLFALVFYFPVKYGGQKGLALTMTLLTAASSLLLYFTVKKNYSKTAWVIVPLLLFQTFLFGISRDAMTEPLASFFICLSLYLLYKQKFIAYACVASFLPLARPELVILLPILAIPLLLNKKYIAVLLLGTGLILWFMGFFITTGHFNAFFKEIFKSGESANRYGHTLPGHHVFKYIYVTGPLVFLMLAPGIIVSIKKFRQDYVCLLSFTAGFLLYIIFSAYLDLGQSGGALRNLITLAPFAAMLSFSGFNFWYSLSPSIQKSGSHKSTAVNPPGGMRKLYWWLYVLFILLIIYQKISDKLISRQFFDDTEKDYTLFLYSLILAVISIVFIYLNKDIIKNLLLGLMAGVQIFFTLSFENPHSHSNIERNIIKQASVMAQSLQAASTQKIFCNHPWMFWNFNQSSSDTTGVVRTFSKDQIDRLPAGAILVWDNHYNNANYTNIDINSLLIRDSYTGLLEYSNNESNFSAVVLIKNSTDDYLEQCFKKAFAISAPNAFMSISYSRFLILKKHDYKNAASVLTDCIKNEPTNLQAYYFRGICYYNLKQMDAACKDLSYAASLGSTECKNLLQSICH